MTHLAHLLTLLVTAPSRSLLTAISQVGQGLANTGELGPNLGVGVEVVLNESRNFGVRLTTKAGEEVVDVGVGE